jgi:aspartate carbamoyltransferase catalytic subunit
MPANIALELRERGMEVIEHENVEEVVRTSTSSTSPDPARAVPGLGIVLQRRVQLPDHARPAQRVKDHLMILHPLPRAGEIDPAVDRTPYARYFEQARNGVPVRMALLHEVMQ